MIAAGDLGTDLLQPGPKLIIGQLIGLGKHHRKGQFAINEEIQHGEVISAGGMADIQKGQDQPNVPVLMKVALDEAGPAAAFAIADLGITVAGQICKAGNIAAAEKVDGGGFAGGGADTRQLLLVEDLIDKGGLAHIAAPRKDDLRQGALRQLVGQAAAHLKFHQMKIHVGVLPFLFLNGTAPPRMLPCARRPRHDSRAF